MQQPCSREMQALLNQQSQSQMSLQDLQTGGAHHMLHNFDPASSHDDFLDQMLSSLPSSCSWPDISISAAAAAPNHTPTKPHSLPWEDHFDDQSTFLASKLRQHQITTGGSPTSKSLMLHQQQLLLPRGLGCGLRSPTGSSGAGDQGLLPVPLNLISGDCFERSQNDIVDASSYKSPGGDNSVQALFNGFSGSLTSNPSQHFHNSQAQSFGVPAAAAMNQAPAASGAAGGGGCTPAQPKLKARARRGQATDPHSIAERLRRERIAERMKALQELVPNANKTDKASMLDEIIDYVKFLQLQVKVLSMSRLGGAGPVAPLVADISSEGGGDCVQGNGAAGRSTNGTQTAASSSNDSMTVTEHQVAKLMEEDMGSAMQYLQGKGLCLMPISLATAISTATCHPTTRNNHPLLQSNITDCGGPSSPSMSVLTVQSATTMGNGSGLPEASIKDATSVSKP